MLEQKPNPPPPEVFKSLAIKTLIIAGSLVMAIGFRFILRDGALISTAMDITLITIFLSIAFLKVYGK
tara:strand:+ start:552 stop:755 length:204 start_codon:yes stop_codon:yes gene_type:complete